MDQAVAIVVLGAAVWAGGVPSPALQRRIAHAAIVARAHPDLVVIVSGGLGQWPPTEADVMRAGLIDLGVSASRIQCEDRSRSTLENALGCRDLMRAAGIERAILVTDSFHMPRALMTFRWLGLAASGQRVRRGGSRLDRWILAWLREGLAMPIYACRLVRQSLRDGG